MHTKLRTSLRLSVILFVPLRRRMPLQSPHTLCDCCGSTDMKTKLFVLVNRTMLANHKPHAGQCVRACLEHAQVEHTTTAARKMTRKLCHNIDMRPFCLLENLHVAEGNHRRARFPNRAFSLRCYNTRVASRVTLAMLQPKQRECASRTTLVLKSCESCARASHSKSASTRTISAEGYISQAPVGPTSTRKRRRAKIREVKVQKKNSLCF